MSPADLLDHQPVLVGRHQARPGSAGDRFEQERRDRRRVLSLDRRHDGVGVVPRHLREVEHERLVALTPGAVAANGHRRQRDAVVAGMASDHLPALGSPAGDVVSACQAQGRVGRLAATTREEDVAHAGRKPARGEHVVQPLAVRRRPDRHDIGTAGERVAHGVGDDSAAVADVGDHRPAGSVEDPPAVVGDQPAAVTTDDRRARRAGNEVIAGGADVDHQRGSRGSPSTRSPRMLRMMFEVPPMIV